MAAEITLGQGAKFLAAAGPAVAAVLRNRANAPQAILLAFLKIQQWLWAIHRARELGVSETFLAP